MTSSAFEAPRRLSFDRSLVSDFLRALLDIPVYVLGPIALYMKPPLSTARSIFPMTADDELLMPLAAHDFLDWAEKRLRSIGFGGAVHAVSRQVATVTSFVSLLEHPQDGSLAIAFVSQINNVPRPTIHLIFHSGFADGTIVATSNSRLVSRTPSLPEMKSLSFPVDDPVALYDLHRIRAQDRARRTVRVPMTRGADPLEYQHQENIRVFDNWIRHGYYRRIANDKLRHTMRGAALSAWRGLFPWKRMTERRNASERDAVLRRYHGSMGR